MKFLKDYAVMNPEFQVNPGPEAMAKLSEEVAAVEVPACPFCGGEAAIQLGSMYRQVILLAVTCSACGARSKMLAPGQTWTGKTVTLSDVLAQAVELWSRRV